MHSLLQFSRAVDALSAWIGRVVMWLILLTTFISAGNAIVRKLFNSSSNALLEIQWYIFAAVFILGAGYAFLRNAHVRFDFISSKFSARTRNWIDIGGIVIFMFPLCYMMITLSWPLFHNAWVSGEMSSNSCGLILWPVYAMIPAGFGLLALQGFSELIKRLAFLKGMGPDALDHSGPSEAELLAKEIAEQEKARQAGASA
jgi:TRAP-type mannitol/chloroaromatic compound transport system permease small subunit